MYKIKKDMKDLNSNIEIHKLRSIVIPHLH